jgi:tripartite-type tricarboxylate transporter receptor subunit TctC
MRFFSRWLACGFWAVILLFPGDSNSQPTYYQGKTITVIQGRSPGGVGDLRLRAVFPFLQRHIPGNPVVVSEYMPGGGGRKTANQVYRARGDGLTIGASSPGILASAVLGEPGVEYDPQKFIYLGSPWSVNNNIFTTRKGAGLNNLEKLRRATGLRIGAQSVGHVQYIRGRLFAWLLDLKDPKFVVGYSGPELDAALERDEIDARAESFDNLLTRGIDNERRLKDFHAILEIPKGHRPPEFAHLPEIEASVRSQIEGQVLTMSRVFWGVGTLIFLPPNTQASLAEVLRQAFRSSFKDKQFHEQYKKVLGVSPTPLLPEDQQKLIEALPRAAEVVEVFKKIAGVDPLPPRR